MKLNHSIPFFVDLNQLSFALLPDSPKICPPFQIARYGRGFSFNPRSFGHAFTVKNPYDLDPRNSVIQRQTYDDDKVGSKHVWGQFSFVIVFLADL